MENAKVSEDGSISYKPKVVNERPKKNKLTAGELLKKGTFSSFEFYKALDHLQGVKTLKQDDGRTFYLMRVGGKGREVFADPETGEQISPQFDTLVSIGAREMVYIFNQRLYVVQPSDQDREVKPRRDDVPELFLHKELTLSSASLDTATEVLLNDESLADKVNLSDIKVEDDPFNLLSNAVEKKDLLGIKIFDKYSEKALQYAINTQHPSLANPDERIELPVIELNNTKPLQVILTSGEGGAASVSLLTKKINEYTSDGGFRLLKDYNGAVKLQHIDVTDDVALFKDSEWDARSPRYAELITLIGTQLDQYFDNLNKNDIEIPKKASLPHENETIHEYRKRLEARRNSIGRKILDFLLSP